MEHYGKTIARLRKEHGYTQNDLGKELNVTYQAVSKWENDLSQPDLETIVAMCKLFGVTLDEFTGLANGREIKEDTAVTAAPEPAPAYSQPAPYNNISNTSASGKPSPRVIDPDENHGFRLKFFLGLVGALVAAIAVAIGLTSGPDGIDWWGGIIFGYIVFSYVALIGHECVIWDVFFWGITKIVDMPGVIFSLDIDGILFLLVYKFLIAPILTLLLWIFFAIVGFIVSFLMAPFVFPFKIPRIIKDTF